MSLANNYLFHKDYCTTYTSKFQLLEVKEVNESEMVPLNNINKTPLNDYSVPMGPINGKLWRNHYRRFMGGFPLPCPEYTYEISGYGTKMTETRTDCCFSISNGCFFDYNRLTCCFLYHPCCPRQYHVEDGQGNNIGDLTHSCCLVKCCAYLTVSNNKNPLAFVIKPICCCICCGSKWKITDGQANEIGEIQSACCSFRPQFEVKFLSQLVNSDKLLLMSSIPFLP